jgi:uncharacterized protein YggE
LTLAAAASGQETPVIVTSGIGEVRIPPERAIIQIGVESQDSSAARAAAATAAKVRAVIDTLVSLGFGRDSLPTVDYRIGRNYYRRGGTEDNTKAYSAESAIELVVIDLDRIGEVIDAALAAGANDIPYVRFDADESGAARREALALAFSQAKADAEALANSAGGVLGNLVEVSTETLGFPAIELAGEIEFATPVTPQGIVRKVRVVARWQLQQR